MVVAALVPVQLALSARFLKAKAVVAPAESARNPSVSARKPQSYYVNGINPHLFDGPPASAVDSVAANQQPPIKPKVQLPPASAQPGNATDAGDYTFTGVVSLNGSKSALVENSKTKSGMFVSIGSHLLNGTVSSIDERTIVVRVNGAKRYISRLASYRLTPLNASAEFLTAKAPPQSAPTTNPAHNSQPVVVQPATVVITVPASAPNPAATNPGSLPQQGPAVPLIPAQPTPEMPIEVLPQAAPTGDDQVPFPDR
jgi:hypothetical protein